MNDTVMFDVDDELIEINPLKLRFTLELFTGVRFGMCLMAKDEPGGEAAFILNEFYMGD